MVGSRTVGLVLSLCGLVWVTGRGGAIAEQYVVHVLSILNGPTFQSDQEVLNRALKANSKNRSSTVAIHSVELMAKGGLAEYLQDLCAAADASSTAWMTIVNLAGQPAVFASAMVGQQLAVPTLAYANTLEPELYKDVAPDYYLGLNPTSIDVAVAVATFVKSQKWNLITSVLHDPSPSGQIFATTLQNRLRLPHNQIFEITSSVGESSSQLRRINAKLRETKSRVQILYCSVPFAQLLLQQARKLNMLGTGWLWILTETAYTTDSHILQEYPSGTIVVRLRPPTLQQTASLALNAVRYAAEQLMTAGGTEAEVNGTFKAFHDKKLKDLNCWNEDPLKPLSKELRAVMQSYTKSLRNYVRNQSESKSFDILGLTLKKSRHRWTHLGNITKQEVVTVDSGSYSWWSGNSMEEGRGRLRVVTRISPPFTIEEYPVSADDGLCLVGLACLRVATNDKDELKAIFTSFDSGLTSSALFNFTCCKGLVMDLLQALSRDVGFDFETYVVADDKDGSSDRSSGSWDGIIKDIRSGAAQMAFASLSVTQARKGVVDFSSPFYYTKFSFLVAATKTKVNLSAFLEPFSWKLWIAIFSALHATAIAAAIFEWISPFGLNPRGRMRSKNFTLASALTTVYSLFFSHVMAFKAPKSWPNKVLINFWGGFCFVILASYTANHAAIYAGFKQPSFENIFDNEDLLSRKVTTIRGSSAEIFVRNINPALHQHMTSNQYFNVVSVEDAVEKLKRGSLDAFIYDTAILSYVQATDAGCTLRTAGASFGSQGYAVALPIGSSLKSAVSTAILKYMESGFMDDIRTKWLTGLSCQMDDSFSSMNQPRALGLEDFAGVFLLLAVGGAVGFLILLLEHLVYRCLPRLRMLPKTSLWHSRHIMFFSQKLYRFINSVDLVSPNSSAKEFASSVKQGQFIGMFQKSVKKRAKEEALQQKRARNADNFFETIHELTRNLREGSSMDIIDNEEALSNGRLPRPQSRSKNGSSPSNNPPMERVADVAEEVMRRSPIRRLNRQPNIGDSLDNVHSTTRSFSDFQNALQDIKSLPKAATSLSLKDNCLPSSRNNVWVAQAAEDGTMYNGFPSMDSDEEDDDTPSPSTPLCAPQPPSKGQRLSLEHDRLPPYTSLRGLDNVDIDEVSKQDLLNMWQLAESDLRLQIRQLAREKAQLVKQVSSASVKKSNTPTDL